jgi:hypothetical protein
MRGRQRKQNGKTNKKITVYTSNVANPDQGSGVFCAFLTLGSGMGKKSGSGINSRILFRISESLETIIWVKILKFSYVIRNRDPFFPGIRDGKFYPGRGSGIRNPVSTSATLSCTRVPLYAGLRAGLSHGRFSLLLRTLGLHTGRVHHHG